MLPVVPKVRVGDVLYATRNLRNWLQTASLMYSLKHIAEGGNWRGSRRVVFTPRKNDRYVVCVNTGVVFAVFNPDPEREMAPLFFINKPNRDQSLVLSSGKKMPIATRARKNKTPKIDVRMSPALFSTWFVRTDERLPDLREWPDYAYALWAGLQLNAASVDGDYRLNLSMPRRHEDFFYGPGHLGNFGSGKRMKDRGTIRTCAQYAIKCGMTRYKEQNGLRHAMIDHALGPKLEDLQAFQQQIKGYVRNPRTKKSVRDDLDFGSNEAIKKLLESLEDRENP